ncbi:Dsf2p [Sporobolomyces koalae]|uniref:Dsf2p n=1 Tax=Sporobolomyces koalae TaxID=500713 RepID=UPI0031825A57
MSDQLLPRTNGLENLRPQRAPFALTSAQPSPTVVLDSSPSRPYPSRNESLRRDGAKQDVYLEAALENRRRNGLPVVKVHDESGALDPSAENQTRAKNDEQQLREQKEARFADAIVTEHPGRALQGHAIRESLMPLAGGAQATISRMTSTRRYMDQLDDEDDAELPEEDDDEEQNRKSWHSGWASEARDSVHSLGVRIRAAKGKEAVTSGPKKRVETVQRESSDDFHYSMYENMSDSVESYPQLEPSQAKPSANSPHPISVPLSPPSSTASPSTDAPVVRLGPTSPETNHFLDNPLSRTAWDTLPVSPPASPIASSRRMIEPTSPAGSLSQKRVRSQNPSTNFSRPFANVAPTQVPGQPATDPSSPKEMQEDRRIALRSDSLESTPSINPLDRKSSLGAASSSIGHSGSSAGGHSMSQSWEERKLRVLAQQEEARRAIMLAREKSHRGLTERAGADETMEELRSSMTVMKMKEDSPYAGEDQSIHFPEISPPSGTESPYLAYDVPSPPSDASQEFVHSAFTEELPKSPPAHSFNTSFSTEPRPAPAPPSHLQASISIPLPIPGSPPMIRRPSETPSLASFYSSGLQTFHSPFNLSSSAPASSESSKQRNVLRKARPSRRDDDDALWGTSAPMSRAGSALSNQSQSSTSAGESAGPWARFRSRSKSRTRTPAPSLPATHKPESHRFPQPPSLRHLASSLSLQATREHAHDLAPQPPPQFPSPSSTTPLSQADFTRLQASRPAFLRSKTSFGNPAGSKDWVLKNVSGPKPVQAGLVQAGDSASIHVRGAGDEVESLADGVDSDGGGLGRPFVSMGGFGMARSVSDQGPSTSQLTSRAGDSIYSSTYSVYSLPPSPLDPPPTSNSDLHFSQAQSGADDGVFKRLSTLAKAKQTLSVAASARPTMMSRTPSGHERRADPVTPEDFLQVGIDHHEAGDLTRAAWCFEQSVRKDGGCGAGMLMYGLTLRHGWGCQLNAPLGFRYLQMAAESVVEDLDRVVFGGRTLTESEANTRAAKSELVLALHEIGVSYRFGWGIEKNKKMAVSYFILSADLGDQDAQQDVAFCFANGKGCKKDLKRAAHYYRLAVAQGAEDWGLSWIYKPKYMDP